MKGYRCKGAMTVFFSVLTVLFLSLACALAEKARVQGARTKAAAVMDLGIFSVFGEFERDLLEEYEVFGVDAAYGGSDFGAENLRKHLDEYMGYNIEEPEKYTILTGSSLFPLEIEKSEVTGFLLLTDENGTVFRDQVVQNLKTSLVSQAASEFLKAQKQAEEMEKAGETYEKQEEAADQGLAQALEEAKNQEETESKEESTDVVVVEPEKPENPLDLIKKIKNMGILGLVMENPQEVSSKKVEKASLPSGRKLEKGTMDWERPGTGILEEALFQEYLFTHFSGVLSEKEAEGELSYQLEYILAGKNSDEENLKSVVHRLLFLREGVNFAYVASNAEMRQSASLLAAAITGGTPGLTAALLAALLAAWAYGESLLDVRILLAGGKVPVVKTGESFRLTLENLGRLLEVLKECSSVQGEGLDYEGYLKMLFLTGKRGSYAMRALDLMETTLKGRTGMGNFRIDHCVAGMEVNTQWKIPLVFSKVPEAFLKEGAGEAGYRTNGKFIYCCQ